MFTINNPTEEDVPTLESWKHSVYILYQKERGENGTDHYQGYVQFNGAQRLAHCKKLNARAHWEVRHGTHEQAVLYCTKEDTRIDDPVHLGSPVTQGRRMDIVDLYDAIKDGKQDAELQEDHTEAYFKYYKAVDRVRANLLTPRTEKPLVLWYHGATGTGKTRKAYEDHPGAYFKDMSNGKWWDGYRQQDCVVFDDMRRDTFKYHELLRLLDRYPLQVEYKGGALHFNSPTIIITSCFPPSDLYETREDLQQLLRRIDKIVEFKVLERKKRTPPGSPRNSLCKVEKHNAELSDLAYEKFVEETEDIRVSIHGQAESVILAEEGQWVVRALHEAPEGTREYTGSSKPGLSFVEGFGISRISDV